MADTVLIKKYSNRRLYDTEKSEYITISQVADKIRSSRVVKVVDAGTGEDVTSYILTQILLEESRKKNILLPSDLLHMVIRFGDNVLSDFFQIHLQTAMESYIARKASFDEQFRAMFQVGSDFTQMARKTFGEINPFTPLKPLMTMFGTPEPEDK